MEHKKLKLCVLLLFGLGLTGLQAQNAQLSSGGNASGSGGSVTFSVGQLATATISGPSGSVAQGVQQPFEISIVDGTDEGQKINLLVAAYPNPTTTSLTLKVEHFSLTNLTYQLFDMNGKLLHNSKIESNELGIDMSRLVPAIYYLKISEENREIKTFKIIKN
jgi:hypothetical protein